MAESADTSGHLQALADTSSHLHVLADKSSHLQALADTTQDKDFRIDPVAEEEVGSQILAKK